MKFQKLNFAGALSLYQEEGRKVLERRCIWDKNCTPALCALSEANDH